MPDIALPGPEQHFIGTAQNTPILQPNADTQMAVDPPYELQAAVNWAAVAYSERGAAIARASSIVDESSMRLERVNAELNESELGASVTESSSRAWASA